MDKTYRDLAEIVRKSQSLCTEWTSAQKSHDARTMSHGVGTLTVQSSCYYVHSRIKGIKLLQLFRWRLKQKVGNESIKKKP